MAYQNGTASDHNDLYRRLYHFLTGRGLSGVVSFTGTGNGTLTKKDVTPFMTNAGTTPDTLTEDWAITCTAAATDGGTFSVVGSVSGAQAAATVGTPYSNGKIEFTIADGTTDFIVGDHFNFSTTQGQMAAAGNAWIYQGTDTDGRHWLKATGLTGTESIYFNAYTYQNVGTDVYSIGLSSATGFNALTTHAYQPGKSPTCWTALWNTDTPYWFVANGQRVVFVTKVSTTYHAGYVGKFFPYATPSEYAYPVYVGGETNDAALRWSSVSESFRHFSDPGAYSAYMFFPSGHWREIGNWYETSGEAQWSINRAMWPYSGTNIGGHTVNRLRELRDNIDGSYTLLPLIPHANSPEVGVYGELDGCYYVSGYNNAAENIITVDGVDHLVVQNIHRTQRYNYWALKLA